MCLNVLQNQNCKHEGENYVLTNCSLHCSITMVVIIRITFQIKRFFQSIIITRRTICINIKFITELFNLRIFQQQVCWITVSMDRPPGNNRVPFSKSRAFLHNPVILSLSSPCVFFLAPPLAAPTDNRKTLFATCWYCWVNGLQQQSRHLVSRTRITQGSYRSWKTWKVMELDNLNSGPGKSWNFGPGPGKSWNFMLANLYPAELPTVLDCLTCMREKILNYSNM